MQTSNLHMLNGIQEAKEIVYRMEGRGSGRTFAMVASLEPNRPTVIVTHDPGTGRIIGDMIKQHRTDLNYNDEGSGQVKIITVKRFEDLSLLRGYNGLIKVDHAVLEYTDPRVLGGLTVICERAAVEEERRRQER